MLWDPQVCVHRATSRSALELCDKWVHVQHAIVVCECNKRTSSDDVM